MAQKANTPATKTRKPRAAKVAAPKVAGPDMAQFDAVLRSYDKADAEAKRTGDEFALAKIVRDNQLIAFTDRYKSIFGQDQKDFALIRNDRDAKKRGEHCLAFRDMVAAFRLDDAERAVMNDPAQKWSRTNDEGKREFGPAWAIEKKLNNWIGRLLADALPILSGEVALVEDADGNKAKAKRAPRTTKPKIDQWLGKIGDVVKSMKKDKASDKPEVSNHDPHIKALETVLKDLTAAYK